MCVPSNNTSPFACMGKLAYKTFADARKVVQNMKRHGKSVHAYRCPTCDEFHVGRRGKPVRSWHTGKALQKRIRFSRD